MRRPGILLGWILTILVVSSLSPQAADLAAARKSLILGDYPEAIRQSEDVLKSGSGDEDWTLLLMEALMTVGRYSNAWHVAKPALEQFPFSIRLRLAARDVALFNADRAQADTFLEELGSLANRRPWAYRDPANLVALGRIALVFGMDPKSILENTFDRARRADPDYRDAHLASADVALQKNDFDLAAKLLNASLKKFPKDPDVHYRLAKAYSAGDRKAMLAEIAETLELNERHIPSRLLLAEHLIDAESEDEASAQIEQVLEVNPHQPEAWALRAVLAHLGNQLAAEEKHRSQALRFYPDNPAVDHLIGSKLSQKYRFAEGADYQRRALKFDPSFVPANSQLAQDLLRLGNDAEGWALVEKVHEADGYDVTAFNLATLKDNLSAFATLTNAHFIVRMGTNEAPVYGEQVMALLSRARTNLVEKYGVELQEPTIVEIFPDQKDFAVRTFGMPGGAGYLGVCFGRVITANSPATQSGKAASWESVLWHEFAHVVTLQMTRNKMPRWLSEGISVYEELTENPAWGQAMTPRYREMILGDDLHKISELSSAFLAPPSGEHLMFAYYQSYLVVRFLSERHGIDSLRKILRDLRAGVAVNDSIARHTAAMDLLETEFSTFARDLAGKLAPTLEWEKPEPSDLTSAEGLPSDWMTKNPRNYYSLIHQARLLIKARKWSEAREPLEQLVKAFPVQTEAGNAYEMLSHVYRMLKEPVEERRVLSGWAKVDSNATEAYVRLMELASADKDWLIVMENVQRSLAINPLAHPTYTHWGKAAEALGKPDEAIRAYSVLLRLDPPDPAGAHYRLARLLHEKRDPAARRHVLQALEEAPRFREAHLLLAEMIRE